MGKITEVSAADQPADLKDKVKGYWSKRSESFLKIRHAELGSQKAQLWADELERLLTMPDEDVPVRSFRVEEDRIKAQMRSSLSSQKICEKGLKILDVGCGTGFFEILLAPMGHDVTGIDLTPEMIEKGNILLEECGVQAKMMVMDAEKLTFKDNTFDAVISRNLTWTLPHPEQAYREWKRVLRPGGVLLVFDAEYAKGHHRYDQQTNRAHRDIGDDLKEECHRIYHMLSISSWDRPAWDEMFLRQIGFEDISIDRTVGDRLYAEKDEFYIPDRMFSIRAVKGKT